MRNALCEFETVSLSPRRIRLAPDIFMRVKKPDFICAPELCDRETTRVWFGFLNNTLS